MEETASLHEQLDRAQVRSRTHVLNAPVSLFGISSHNVGQVSVRLFLHAKSVSDHWFL